jgi:hypothetical protein
MTRSRPYTPPVPGLTTGKERRDMVRALRRNPDRFAAYLTVQEHYFACSKCLEGEAHGPGGVRHG